MNMRDLGGEPAVWSMVALASAGLGGILARNGLEAAWQRIYKDEPPQNPAARSVDWTDALAWTVASGLAIGVGRLLAQRGAAAGWKTVRGRYPRGLE